MRKKGKNKQTKKQQHYTSVYHTNMNQLEEILNSIKHCVQAYHLHASSVGVCLCINGENWRDL